MWINTARTNEKAKAKEANTKVAGSMINIASEKKFANELSAITPRINVAEIDPESPIVLYKPYAVALLSLFEKVPARLYKLTLETT